MAQNIFILGAGASCDAGIPVMNNFLKVARNLKNQSKISPNSKELFDLVFRAKKEITKMQSKFNIENPNNIEVLFAQFEMAELLGKLGDMEAEEIVNLKKAVNILISETIENSFYLNPKDDYFLPSDTYNRFVQLIQKILLKGETVSIITFNYDIALEYALQFNRQPFDYCLLGGSVLFDSNSKIKLLKLHGSLNWYKGSGQEGISVMENSIEQGHIRHTANDLRSKLECLRYIRGQDAEVMIVPPTYNKMQHHSQLKNVWQNAALELSNCKRIHIIGYSLPNTDHFFRDLFAQGTLDVDMIDEILVYDPDPEIETRFKDLFGNETKGIYGFRKTYFSDSIEEIGSLYGFKKNGPRLRVV